MRNWNMIFPAGTTFLTKHVEYSRKDMKCFDEIMSRIPEN
jgi:hypothetical protein